MKLQDQFEINVLKPYCLTGDSAFFNVNLRQTIFPVLNMPAGVLSGRLLNSGASRARRIPDCRKATIGFAVPADEAFKTLKVPLIEHSRVIQAAGA
jgi:hypothetical protein